MKNWHKMVNADPTRWLLQDTFNDKFQVRIEVKGKPSKWVTLNALTVLKRHFG